MMLRALALVAGLLVFASVASAQVGPIHLAPPRPHQDVIITHTLPPPAPNDTLHMKTKIGSFKLVRKGPELPNGRLEFSFAGTVLVSGLVPGSTLKTIGDLREEYDNKEQGKQVFFGKGKIIIVGEFRACQWFGTDLDFSFKGSAVVRVTSEFDKNLSTGSFWYDDNVVSPLQVQMITIVVPKQNYGPVKAITREQFEQMKKQKGHS